MLRGDIEHALQRGQGAAGKDVALDEVDIAPRLLVTLVADGDRLQQHQAVVPSSRAHWRK